MHEHYQILVREDEKKALRIIELENELKHLLRFSSVLLHQVEALTTCLNDEGRNHELRSLTHQFEEFKTKELSNRLRLWEVQPGGVPGVHMINQPSEL